MIFNATQSLGKLRSSMATYSCLHSGQILVSGGIVIKQNVVQLQRNCHMVRRRTEK